MAVTLQSLFVTLGLDTTNFEAKIGQATQQIFPFAGASGRVGQALIQLIGIEGAFAEPTKLNAVLAATGRLTEETSQAFQDLAARQAESTSFSKTQTLSLERLLVTFGLTNKEILRATPILQDFALATGRDAAEAARILGMAASGSTFALRRLGPEFKVVKDSSDPLNDTLATMERLSEGTAKAQAATLGGALAILRNAMNNTLATSGAPFLGVLTHNLLTCLLV